MIKLHNVLLTLAVVMSFGMQLASCSVSSNNKDTPFLNAIFSYSPASPVAGQEVQFTDKSTGTPTSWQWDFGDGGLSTLQNPSHAYITAGTYLVTLNVGSASGTSNATRTITASSASLTYELPADRTIDWTATGVPGGIKTRTKTHAVTGVYGDDSHDDRAAIQAAINACPSGEVVLLPAGTFKLSSALVITTPITLRGQGPTTILKGYSRNTPCVLQIGAGSSYNFSAEGTSITSGYAKGSTSIVVSSASGFTTGRLMLIDQLNDGTFVSNTGSSGTASWVGRANGTRAMRQLVKITGISGTTIRFSPALFYTYAATLSPQASVISTAVPALAADGGSIGVENLTVLDGGGNSGNARGNITWKVCTNSWLYKVSSINCHSYHILSNHILQNSIKQCYISGAYEIAPSRAYGIEISDGSCSNLIEDNIVIGTSAELICENGASGNVVAYNYAEPGSLTQSPNSILPGLQPSHGAHPMFNLYESNYTAIWMSDFTWGTSSHNVAFRNRLTGSFGSLTESIIAVDVNTGQNHISIIGNILGTAGEGFIYEKAWPASYGYNDFLIYRLGYAYGSTATSPFGGTDTATTILRHGNYDVVNNSIIYNGSDIQTLPSSFYLASKPSWFGSLSWPAIGPDVSEYVTDIPAKWRWDQFKMSGLLSDLFKDHQ
jgi:PKD repeat protein